VARRLQREGSITDKDLDIAMLSTPSPRDKEISVNNYKSINYVHSLKETPGHRRLYEKCWLVSNEID